MNNSRHLKGTSTAMILGAIAGGLAMYNIEGNNGIELAVISGALSAGIAGGLSSIKTNHFCTTATKITASTITSATVMAALTGMVFAYLESDVQGEKWGGMFVMLELFLGLISGTIGAISSHYIAERTDQDSNVANHLQKLKLQ